MSLWHRGRSVKENRMDVLLRGPKSQMHGPLSKPPIWKKIRRRCVRACISACMRACEREMTWLLDIAAIRWEKDIHGRITWQTDWQTDGADGCKDASSKTNKTPTFLLKILITLVSDKSMTDGPTYRPSHRDGVRILIALLKNYELVPL